MTLLQICQKAARYAGVNVPTSIVGNNDEDATRLLSAIEMETSNLAREHNWTILMREHTFSTSAATDSYSLPSDFSRMIHNTHWNRSDQERTPGPVGNQRWQEWQSGILTPVISDNWRIFPNSGTNEFFIEPTPTATETIAFEYITNEIIQSGGGAGQTEWMADTDVPRLDEHLTQLGVIWRVLNRYGYNFAAEKTEYENQKEMAKARDAGNRVLNMAARRGAEYLGAYTPEAGYGQ